MPRYAYSQLLQMVNYQDRFTMRTFAWRQSTNLLVVPSGMPETMPALCWWTSAMPGAVWGRSYQTGLPHSSRSARVLDKPLQQLGRYNIQAMQLYNYHDTHWRLKFNFYAVFCSKMTLKSKCTISLTSSGTTIISQGYAKFLVKNNQQQSYYYCNTN